LGKITAILFMIFLFITAPAFAEAPKTPPYAGSLSCRECHEKFYQLWSTSRHGLAMQPYTPELAKANLTPHKGSVAVGKLQYRADVDKGLVIEKGPKGTKQYTIEQVMGGKNVYYFLTSLQRGRLQTLPVAYDVNTKEWFDMAASGIRHFPGGEQGQTVNWRESPYTFNTACYSCHVSQLSTNYDPKTDTYRTVWAEPGINCETCHGSSTEHNRVMKETPKGQQPKDTKIISVKGFSAEQHNSSCSVCHVKGIPLTTTVTPGDRLFDHFDLVGLESPDYYPDGRDLGENYTYTSWLMSPCVKSGQLHCVKCHTSSGRYRFKAEEKANDACMPCHKDKVKEAPAHTRHKAGSPGNKCVSCHMPMTSFARMNRSDHSMIPPVPAATIQYKSPNACNLCHKDKDAAWADRQVREWRTRDYQAPLLKRASLIDGARKENWSVLPEMLAYIQDKSRDEVVAASLIRLTMSAKDDRVTPAFLAAIKDPSPLVRSAACEAIAIRPTREGVMALLDATGDDYRVVRIRAAAGLAGYPLDKLSGDVKTRVEKATREYLAFIMARPDQWTSHYNMGNYHLSRREPKEAVASYKAALKLEPQAVMAMVNSSLAYAGMGQNDMAEKSLTDALNRAPDNAAVNLNMGLLKAEKGDTKGAEEYLKAALRYDPLMAQAAHNLCIILSKDRLGEAVEYCRKASGLRPDDPKYGYSLAFFLNQKGETAEAVRILKLITEKHPVYRDAGMLLREISEKKGERP
jgi:tetratricopeptide (TPR) repeat protein